MEVKKFLQLIREANLPGVLDWGIIYKGQIIRAASGERVHNQIWERVQPKREGIRIEWVFEALGPTLFIRIIVPHPLKREDILKINGLDQDYNAIKELLKTIPYEHLELEYAEYASNTMYQQKVNEKGLLSFLQLIFGLR